MWAHFRAPRESNFSEARGRITETSRQANNMPLHFKMKTHATTLHLLGSTNYKHNVIERQRSAMTNRRDEQSGK